MAHKYKYVSTGGGYSVLNNGVVTEVINQDGTIKGDIKEALAQGSIYIGNSSGVTSELSVKTNTGVLVGNGTTATVVSLSGNATMTNAGVVTVTGASGDFAVLGNTTIGNAFTDTLTINCPSTIGSISTPITLAVNPGATVATDTVNILHSAGAGDCNDLLGRYTKVAISGDGDSGLTLVASAPKAYVLGGTTVAKEIYASQPWAKHTGTGTITAMSALSALVDVDTGAFTASTVNAGHFHITGAATVTGQFDGVMIEVYPDVTCLDSAQAIAVDSGAVVASAQRFSGDYTSFLNFAAANTAVVISGTVASGNGAKIAIMIAGTPYYINAHPTSNN